MGRSILIIGGARSGKSSFAERLASTSSTPVSYVATARPSDAEMSSRIDRHKKDRFSNANASDGSSILPSSLSSTWSTVEEPVHLSDIKIPDASSKTIVVDCLTVWLGNWMKHYGYPPNGEDVDESSVEWADGFDASARAEIKKFLDRFEMEGKTIILVTNEVGLGIVPMYKASRHYRDTLGRINQDIARRAEKVYLLVAGCAVDIKKLDAEATL
ncbi:hypothetical protein HDU97_002744 [Phlyctochytrium planicorne]|nr:hypothetical protein HDU97_002744 [Phlyctochytrium planicorne]